MASSRDVSPWRQARILLSHACRCVDGVHDDTPHRIARRLARDFGLDYSCWPGAMVGQGNRPGGVRRLELGDKKIPRTWIEECTVFVFVASREAWNEYSTARRELELAREKGVSIGIVRIDDSDVPEKYSDHIWLDLNSRDAWAGA